MDAIHTDQEYEQDEEHPKVSAELPESQQPISSTNDALQNSDETTFTIKPPEEPAMSSPPDQNPGHFSEKCPQTTEMPSAPCEPTQNYSESAGIPSLPCEPSSTTHPTAHSNDKNSVEGIDLPKTGHPHPTPCESYGHGAMGPPMHYTSQQPYMDLMMAGLMVPYPQWHPNTHCYPAPHPRAVWQMAPPPQPYRSTQQKTKGPGININIRVGKCAHDAGTTEKFSSCGICCCLLIPIIGCIFCMKSKDVVCVKCDKVIGKASREKETKRKCKETPKQEKEKKKIKRNTSLKKRTDSSGKKRKTKV